MKTGMQEKALAAAVLVEERASWPGRGKRVTASTLVERGIATTIDEARDVMWAAASTGLVDLALKRGMYWDGAILIAKAVAS